jgi:hypothetical protein
MYAACIWIWLPVLLGGASAALRRLPLSVPVGLRTNVHLQAHNEVAVALHDVECGVFTARALQRNVAAVSRIEVLFLWLLRALKEGLIATTHVACPLMTAPTALCYAAGGG